MESIQNFGGGMDLDTNPLNLQKGKYKEANNIRIVNDVNSTSFSVNNIKGNEFNITIPSTPIFQKIEIIGVTAGATQTLTINGQTGSSFTTAGLTPSSLYDYITDDGAYTLLGVEYNIYIGNSYLLVVPVIGFTLTMSTSDPLYINIDSTFIPAQTNLEIIGSVKLRDDIYLFTTNNTTKNPGGHSPDTSLAEDPSSVGQIWKYEYDKITLTGTLTLVYNNYVDFSTYYTITPTATTGRYENSQIQRIYWTDNFNKLRTLNVVDPNSLAIDVSLLDIQPPVDVDRPTMTDIGNSTGSIGVGVYQSAYRLKNTGGATTNFSELSDLVYIVDSIDEHASIGGAFFKDYVGGSSGATTSKQITWTISNLDTDFDRIEVVVLFRANVLDVPTVLLVKDEPISSSTHRVVYDGTGEIVEMTFDEFTTLAGRFTHCKTIETKDNRLFAANIRNQFSEIDYDARAFRAFTSGADDIVLTNNGVSNIFNSSTAQALDETEDTINDYSNPALACYYKPNTSILGGAGLNISYEFYTQAIAADIDTNASGPFGIPDGVAAPWRHTNPDYTQTSLDLGVDSFSDDYTQVGQTIPTAFPNQINAGFKYPPYTSALRGFQRNEIYRFGIQFFDKSKNPTFVKWIGDIKMPDFFDPNPNSFYNNGVATGVTDFRLSFVGNNSGAYDEAFVQALGIKFTVNIPTDLTSQIDGYSIVRVKREEKDKTIISQGYITFAEEGSDNNIYTTSPSVDASGNTSATPLYDRGFFITPDILDNVLSIPTAGMSMKIKGILNNVNTDGSISIGGAEPYYMYKYYDHTNNILSSGTYTLSQIDYIGYAGNLTDTSSSVSVYNYDVDLGNITLSHSIGNPAYYFRTSTSVNYIDIFPAGKLLVNIERTLSNQYGGNTYTDRANNTYISCSHYRPIRKVNAAISDSFQLFGGDIFVCMQDSCRWAKNWGSTSRGQSATRYSTTFFFPVEAICNAELRGGTYMNKSFALNFDATSTEMKELPTYNGVYSAQCDIKQYFPKPDPFITNEEFDNRVYASEIKINGEFTDSWGIFKANNYWDVEGTNGPINAILSLQDKIYFWQTRAFGVLQINPRAVVTDINNPNNSQLQLGTGLPLQRHDYISTEIGLQHQWGVTKSSYKLFWLDVANKKFYAYSPGQSLTPESDVKGMFSYLSNNLKYNILTTDKPTYSDMNIGINGIRCIYDFKYNQAIFTVHDGRNISPETSLTTPFTFVFDERMNSFTSFHTYFPRIYFTDGYKIFSTNPLNLDDIYIHDEGDYGRFYGILNPSTIKIIVNDNFQYTKVFDNIMYDSQAVDPLTSINYFDDTWTTIRIYNNYQNTDYQTLIPNTNIKRKERTWQLAIPRNRVLYTSSPSPDIFTDLSPTDKIMGERIRDKWIAVDLSYNNLTNRDLALNNFRTSYRQSQR